MATQNDFLSAARINAVMQGLNDPRLIPQNLVWNQRIPMTPAFDEEIMARFIGTVLIADLIADDAKAAVYSQGKFQFETTKIPNLKLGISMNQTMLNQLDRLRAGMAMANDVLGLNNWENRTVESLLLGVRQRIEALNVAMLVDGLSYDKLGIKMTDVSWGMPSDLKVTSGTAWTTAGSATPVTDINTIKRLGRVRYGVNFNRITMSTPAFMLMQATTEFQNQAKLFGYGLTGMPGPTIPLSSDATVQELAKRIFGGDELELYDARYWSQDANGVTSSLPFLPINKVILTDKGNDGNAQAMDFANGTVTETIVANAANQVNISGRLPVGPGPVAYATVPADLNPPGITYWAVARGFPRKGLLQASAVLNVGTVTETISTALPF